MIKYVYTAYRKFYKLSAKSFDNLPVKPLSSNIREILLPSKMLFVELFSLLLLAVAPSNGAPSSNHANDVVKRQTYSGVSGSFTCYHVFLSTA